MQETTKTLIEFLQKRIARMDNYLAGRCSPNLKLKITVERNLDDAVIEELENLTKELQHLRQFIETSKPPNGATILSGIRN